MQTNPTEWPLRSRSFQIYSTFSALVLPLDPNGPPDILPYGGFACCSPCDGSSETPSVPRFLPRPLPRGEYQWGVFADANELVVALDASNAAASPALENRVETIEHVIFFHPDGLLYSSFEIDRERNSRIVTLPCLHGPRAPEVPKLDWRWSVKSEQRPGGRSRTIWTFARSDVDRWIQNGRLRAALSRCTLATMEGVAWGAYGVWAPRFDEAGTFVFENRAQDQIPCLREAVLHYDPDTLQGHFALTWENLHTPPRELELKFTDDWRRSDWNRFSVRLNSAMESFPLQDRSVTGNFDLHDGWNELRISSRDANHARIFLEICRDDVIVAPSFSAPIEHGRTQDWVRGELQQMVENRGGIHARYERWMGPAGTGVARWCLGGEAPKGWHEWVRDLGDFTLGLQRKDGTFSGFHVSESGTTDVRWRGGAFDCGPIGELWLNCYRLTGEEKFLAASTRLVATYEDYRVEFNHNYAAFALYHLAEHYKLTGDKEALQHGEYYLRRCVARHVLPLGFHGGHNYYSIYASIILRALALGVEMLPERHPLLSEIHGLMRRMTNQALRRLQADGSFESRDRHRVSEKLWLDGLFEVHRVSGNTDQQQLEGVLGFILDKAMSVESKGNADLFSFDSRILARSSSLADFLLRTDRD